MTNTPDSEFDLGVVQPDERIVRELEGTRVVHATVVKASDLDGGMPPPFAGPDAGLRSS